MNDNFSLVSYIREKYRTRLDEIGTPAPKRSKGGVVEGGDKELALVSELNDIENVITILEGFKKAAENRLKTVLGEAENLVVDGTLVVTWKNIPSNRIDVTYLKENHPRIAAKCLVESSSRRFIVKKVSL